ncbi:hypothetical protein, partial [Latilactobacillus graminis]|uniref:hypothetical protein n=1 Tax=Latilactobacillus graminis TaxID=60519 RepID=UPI001F209779
MLKKFIKSKVASFLTIGAMVAQTFSPTAAFAAEAVSSTQKDDNHITSSILKPLSPRELATRAGG